MDGRLEELQTLSVSGIVSEAFRILRSLPKLFTTITCARILLFRYISLQHALVSISFLRFLFYGTNIDEERAPNNFSWELLLYAVLALSIWWLSMAAVSYTVALVYTDRQKPSFAAVKNVHPTLPKRAVLTSLWFFIIVFAISLAYGFSVFLLMWVSCPVNKFSAAAEWLSNVALIFSSAVYACVCVYMAMIWQVASVASILEENCYGLKAMKKAKRLIEGNRAKAMVLTILYLIFEGLHGYGVFKFAIWDVLGRIESFAYGALIVGEMESFAYGALIVVEGCVITLIWAVTKNVFYFACKSHHKEGVDDFCLLDNKYLPLSSTDVQAEIRDLVSEEQKNNKYKDLQTTCI